MTCSSSACRATGATAMSSAGPAQIESVMHRRGITTAGEESIGRSDPSRRADRRFLRRSCGKAEFVFKRDAVVQAAILVGPAIVGLIVALFAPLFLH